MQKEKQTKTSNVIPHLPFSQKVFVSPVDNTSSYSDIPIHLLMCYFLVFCFILFVDLQTTLRLLLDVNILTVL